MLRNIASGRDLKKFLIVCIYCVSHSMRMFYYFIILSIINSVGKLLVTSQDDVPMVLLI